MVGRRAAAGNKKAPVMTGAGGVGGISERVNYTSVCE